MLFYFYESFLKWWRFDCCVDRISWRRWSRPARISESPRTFPSPSSRTKPRADPLRTPRTPTGCRATPSTIAAARTSSPAESLSSTRQDVCVTSSTGSSSTGLPHLLSTRFRALVYVWFWLLKNYPKLIGRNYFQTVVSYKQSNFSGIICLGLWFLVAGLTTRGK